MGQARKYSFDTEFAADGAIVRASTARLSPEAVEAERAAAYDRGRKEALAETEPRAAAALEALAQAASAILARLDAESRALRDDAAALSLAAARKIAGAALDGFGDARVLASIEAAMEMLRHQPRLLVRLAPDMAAQLKPRIDALCERHAYVGAIILREDSAQPVGAVSIDWCDGVVIIDPEDVARRIDALIQTTLADPAIAP